MDLLLIVILILGGLVLILAEVCTPAFGVLALAAVGAFAWAVYLCFAVHTVLGFVVVGALLAGLPFYLAFLVRLLPKTPLGRRLALRKDPRLKPGTGVPSADAEASLVGTEGVAVSALRPSGTVALGGRRLPATAESAFIPAGARVRVIRARGLNLVVRAIDEPDNQVENP